MKKYPPLEKLKSLLDYDPATGIFRWKISREGIKKGKIAGSRNTKGYINIFVDRKSYTAHRLAWYIAYGYLPQYIDHINRNPSDNRLSNLRECTVSQNLANVKGHGKNKYKGVSYYKRNKKYLSQIMCHYKRYYLGSFKTPEAAALAYNKKALELFGEFACLNEVL